MYKIQEGNVIRMKVIDRILIAASRMLVVSGQGVGYACLWKYPNSRQSDLSINRMTRLLEAE